MLPINAQHKKLSVIDKKMIEQEALIYLKLVPVKLGQSLNLDLNLNLNFTLLPVFFYLALIN